MEDGREPERSGYFLGNKLTLEYPDARGWYPFGCERGNDSALYAMGWYGLVLSLHTMGEAAELMLQANFADNLSVLARVSLAGAGSHEIRIRPDDFEIKSAP